MIDEEFEEFKINYEKAQNILVYIFLLVDFLILFIFNNFVNPKIDDIKFLKNKILLLIVIDSLSNMFYIVTYNYINIFFNEILYTILSTYKFYIILSFIYKIFLSTKIVKESSNIHLWNPFYLCILYVLLIFPYNIFLQRNTKILIIFEFFTILVCLFSFYQYINKITQFLIKFIKSYHTLNENVFLYLQILNYASLITFICYNFMKIITKLFNNNLLILYINILKDIFFESLRYLLFYILIKIAYIINNNYDNLNNKKDEESSVIIKN